MDNTLFPALCALAGSIIGVAGGVISTLVVQRYETKRRKTEALIKAGMEQWHKELQLIEKGRVAQGSLFYSPEVYMLHLLQFTDILESFHKLPDKELESRITQAMHKIDLIAHTTDKHSRTVAERYSRNR